MISRLSRATVNQQLEKTRSFLAGNAFFSNFFNVRWTGNISALAADSSGNVYAAR
jgi:hypothetical protein